MADAPQLLEDATHLAMAYWKRQAMWLHYRTGNVAQYIDRVIPWEGQSMTFNMGTQMLTNVRSTDDLEGAMPDIQKMNFGELTVSPSHMRSVDASVGYSIAMREMLTGEAAVVKQITVELIAQTEEGLAEKRNHMLVQGVRAIKAKIADLKTEYGSADYTSGDTALLQLTGSVGVFKTGELVDIRDEGTDTVIVPAATILAVIPDEYLGGNNVGPAIVVQKLLDDFTDVSDGDEIVASGEEADHGLPGAFDTLCDFTAPNGSSTPADYFNINRYEAEGYYMIPNGRAYGDTAIDVNTHLTGDMVRQLGRVIPAERAKVRQRAEFDFFKGLVMFTGQDLGAKIAEQAGDPTATFQRKTAADVTSAGERLVAVAGWDQTVLHQIGFPPIAVEIDCTVDNTGEVTVFDPNHWAYIRAGGKSARPTWLREGNARWLLDRYASGDAGYVKLAKRYRAGCMLLETVICFRPRTVWQGQGLTVA